MTRLREQEGAVGVLLLLLLAVLLLVVAYPPWLPQRQTLAPAPSPPPQPILTAQRAPVPSTAIPQSLPVPASPGAEMLTAIQRLIEQGKRDEAEAQLRRVPAETLTDLAMRMNVAALWNNLGVAQAKASGTAKSLPAYKQAVLINPRNTGAVLNLMLAYYELKDPALTADFIEEAIRLAPQDPMPHLILAERFIEKDDLSSAAVHLQHAKERTAGSPHIQALLNDRIAYLERAAKAEHRFAARDSSHFTVKFDGGEDYEVWDRVLNILEDAYRDIGQQLGYFPNKPILVVLHTRERFHDATGGPAWSDGLYDPSLGRIRIPTQGALTDQAWLTRVLRHEFVHALLHDRMNGRQVPQWFNEGLAMQLAGDPPPDIPALVRGEVTLVNLAYLEGPWGGFNQFQALVAYLEANSATKYLIDRFGMQKVRDILEQLAAGHAFGPAFQDRLFISYDDFQRRWVESLNQKS